MIRLARCTQASKAGHYFRLHLEAGDNVATPVRTNFALRPKWHGPAVIEVGLKHATPTAKHLTRLGRGLHPTEPVRLAPAINRKRAYYDLTIAVTKSVSLVALLRADHPATQNVIQAYLLTAGDRQFKKVGKLIQPQKPGGPAMPSRQLRPAGLNEEI